MAMQKGVQRLYSEVAETYELVNHILTFGLDMYWRKKAARKAAEINGSYWLDVASGTGEMAQNLSRLAKHRVKIVSVDFSHPMLSKAREKKYDSDVFFCLADGKSLPFPDDSFDLVTISFATRNINTRREMLIDHLKEFCRVLKPGGCLVNLETSQPSINIIRKLFHLYIKLTVNPIGYFLSGSKAAYRYLSHTIPRFYPPEELSLIIREAGFDHVIYRPYLLGVSAIHTAKKKTQKIKE